MNAAISFVCDHQRILKRGEARRMLKRAKGKRWPGFDTSRLSTPPPPPVPVSETPLSRRMEVATDFMGSVFISPEELASHHKFRIGSEFHELIVKPQNVDLRESMARAVGRPEIAEEGAFFAWYRTLVMNAYDVEY